MNWRNHREDGIKGADIDGDDGEGGTDNDEGRMTKSMKVSPIFLLEITCSTLPDSGIYHYGPSVVTRCPPLTLHPSSMHELLLSLFW